MKICFWGNIFSALEGKPAGGAEKQMAALGRVLSDMGHEVVVADTRIPQNVVINKNLSFLSIRDPWLKPAHQRIWHVYRIFKEIHADIYYARLPSLWQTLPFVVAKKNKALFALGMASDLDTLSFKHRYREFYSKISIAKFIKHIFHTELAFNFLLKRADIVFAQHTGQVTNLEASGIRPFICPNISAAPIADPIDPPFHHYFIFIGKLNSQKGLKETAKIIRTLTEVNFVVIGRPASDHAARIIGELSRKPNCLYLNQVSNRTVIGWLRKSMALISTSTMEGFPNTFLESWSVGVPVISLYSNPDNAFSNSFLGIYFDEDLQRLLFKIPHFEEDNYDENLMKAYVQRHHSQETAGQAFVLAIKMTMLKE